MKRVSEFRSESSKLEWNGISYSCGIEMIFFNDEKLKKWNLRLLKSSVRISCSIQMLSMNNERLKKWNPSLLKSSMRNKTCLPYSCGIEKIFFNDERLKNWNPNLSKSSICIAYSISFQFGWIWTKLTYLTLVASKGSDHLAHSWVKKFEGQRSTGPAPTVHPLWS